MSAIERGLYVAVGAADLAAEKVREIPAVKVVVERTSKLRQKSIIDQAREFEPKVREQAKELQVRGEKVVKRVRTDAKKFRGQVREFQENLRKHGVWVSEPVPMYAFPGSPDYFQRFGAPDDYAWERAHEHYLSVFRDKGFSDIQDQQPAPIEDLECTY